MLRFNLSHIFQAKAITKPSAEIINAGFGASTATKIRKGQLTTLNLSYVEKLCDYFHCTPNDLLEWLPSQKQLPAEEHSLHPLLRNKKQSEVLQILNNLPFDKLQKAEDFLKTL